MVGAGIDVGAAFSTTLLSDLYPIGTVGFVPGPLPPGSSYNFAMLEVQWGLSGGGDVFSHNGRVDIIEAAAPVPDPVSTACLMLLAMGGLGILCRRVD